MALTVGTRVQVTLSGEVPPPTQPHIGNTTGFGFGGSNATRNKVGKLTMFAKTFIILDNKFFIPMTSVIQIEILPSDQQQVQQNTTGFGTASSSFGNTTGSGFGQMTISSSNAVQKEDQPISIQFSHPKYV